MVGRGSRNARRYRKGSRAHPIKSISNAYKRAEPWSRVETVIYGATTPRTVARQGSGSAKLFMLFVLGIE